MYTQAYLHLLNTDHITAHAWHISVCHASFRKITVPFILVKIESATVKDTVDSLSCTSVSNLVIQDKTPNSRLLLDAQYHSTIIEYLTIILHGYMY